MELTHIPQRAWCLGCDYPLAGLDSKRCPECGREFDPHDLVSYNSDRPLTRLDRIALSPTGWPTITAIVAPCLWVLYLGVHPGTSLSLIKFYLTVLLCLVLGVILGCRTSFRAWIPPSRLARKNFTRRDQWLCATVALTCILMWLNVPLRVAFLTARPELDRLVARIQSGTIPSPVTNDRAGIYSVSTGTAYGADDQIFFVSRDYFGGGFAHSPNTDKLSYNAGEDGHLIGPWYWWQAD